MFVPVSLSTLTLPQDAQHIRIATRDRVLRHEDFDEKFDAHTVICDLFESAEPGILTAVCPPMLNLWDDLDLRAVAQPSGQPCPILRTQRINTDLLSIQVPDGTTTVDFETTLGCFSMAPQPDLTEIFAGKRAVFTLSKDNDLAWIRDWAAYYAREHGADTAIVYDNKSTRYTREDLIETLAGVHELTDFAVIDWPFSYGPNDHRRDTTMWMCEADYCQRNMFEHVAARLLPRAAGAVNVDIDELIYASDGTSLFAALDRSPSGYLLVPGTWIDAVHDGNHDSNRHAAYYRRRAGRFPERCEEKWAVDPRKLPANVQWVTHSIMGAVPARDSAKFTFAHFRGINTNWDLHMPASGTTLRTHADDTADYEEVAPLRDALRRAFPDRGADMIDTAPMPESDGRMLSDIARQIAEIGQDPKARNASAQYWYHQAVIARARSGETETATKAARKAWSLEPTCFEFLDYYVTCLIAATDEQTALDACKTSLPLMDDMAAARTQALTAVVLYRLADYEGALAALDAAQSVRLNAPCDWVLRGQLEEKIGNMAAAERAFQMAIQVASSPDRLPPLLADIARESLVTGFIANMGTISAERLDLLTCYRNLGHFYKRCKRPQDALKVWLEVNTYDPMAVDVYRAMSLLLVEMGATDRADLYASDALELAEDSFIRGPYSKYNEIEIDYWFADQALRVAEMLVANSAFDRAMELIDEVMLLPLEFPPTQHITNIGFGMLIAGANDHVRALADRLLLGPLDDHRPYRLAVEADLRRGITGGQTASYVKKLAKEEPETAPATLSRYARVLEQADRPKQAAHFYTLAAEADGSNPRFAIRALQTYETLGDYEMMVKIGGKLRKDHPDSHMVHFIVARAHSRRKELAQAREAVEACLKIEPTFEQGLTMAARLDSQLSDKRKHA